MKKLMGLLLAGLAVFVLNGCGDGYNDYEVTYHLQTYNADTENYEGVEGVYYECGPDIVGHTDRNGAFTMIEGDYCTFYDLDDTLSYEYDTLYIGLDVWGDIAVGDIRYDCDSGIYGITDELGMFIFDPDHINNITTGDICEFNF